MSALPHVTYEPNLDPTFMVRAYEVGDLGEQIGLDETQIDNLHIHVSRVAIPYNSVVIPKGVGVPNFVDDGKPIGFFEPSGDHVSALRIADQLGYERSKIDQLDTSTTRRRGFIASLRTRPLICLFGSGVIEAAESSPESHGSEGIDTEVAGKIATQGLIFALLKYHRDIEAVKKFYADGPDNLGKPVLETVRNNLLGGMVLSAPFYATGRLGFGLAVSAGSVGSALLRVGVKMDKINRDPRHGIRVPQREIIAQHFEDITDAMLLSKIHPELVQVEA